MTQTTLTLTYQPPTGATLTDPRWIRIEPVYPPADRATVGQAAALLDAAFGVEICAAVEGEELVNLGEPALDAEAFLDAAGEVVDLSYCDGEWDGSLAMELKIVRSHDLPYVLRLIGCEQTGPAVRTSETAHLITVAADTITTEWPIVAGLECEPAPLAREGNTLRFGPDQVGQTVRASWTTELDLVPIRIPARAFEQDTELRALAFMGGMVADEVLSPEPPEPPDYSLCPRTTWQGPDTDDTVTCYQIVRTHRLCACSKTEMGVDEIEEIVPCPEDVHCANNETACMHLLGTVSQTVYVDCGPTDRTGTFDGALDDPQFYLEKCCEWPTKPLPHCSRRTLSWRGGASITHGEQHYRDLYGASTRFVPLTPPGGICGEWTVEQRLMGNNCCDGVDPLVVVADDTDTVVAPSSTALITLTGGGRFPNEVSVSGTGFWLDPQHTRKQGQVSGPRVWVFTDASACGPASVRIADGCSSLIHTLRSTVGRWRYLDYFDPIQVFRPWLNGWLYQLVNLYTDPVPGSGDWYDGPYCLCNGNPGNDTQWKAGTGAPWVTCAMDSSSRTTILDPVVGRFSFLASPWAFNIGPSGICAPEVMWRYSWITRLTVWEWIC